MGMRMGPRRRGAATSKSPGPGWSVDQIAWPELIAAAYGIQRRQSSEGKRQNTEETALAQHCFRKALEDCLGIGLMVIGLSGRQVHVSKAFCNMVRWTHEELIGRHFPFPYWPAEEVGVLTRYFQSVILETEHPPKFESRFQRKDGSVFDVLLMVSPLKDGRGKLSGWAFSVGDLTERKTSESAVVEYERKLSALSSQLLAAYEEERRVIACEIHDTICSCLAAVGFGLQKLNQEDPVVKSLIEITARAMKDSRRIMTDLRPSTLDDLGLIQTINWFCRDFQGVYSNLEITADIDVAEEVIPDELKIVIFRILQEAFNNIAKHSHADSVSLSLKAPGYIELRIKDNGTGFNINKVFHSKKSDHGIGLESMRHRAEISGGTFEIESARRKGTTIRVSWPLQGPDCRRSSSPGDQYSLFISNT